MPRSNRRDAVRPIANGPRVVAGDAALPSGLRGRRMSVGSEELIILDLPLEPSREPNDERTSTLTTTERHVLELALVGYSNAEIAAARGTAPSTAAKHLEAVFRKLGVGSRAELASRFRGPLRA